MTVVALRERRLPCQGLHNGTFLPYGFSYRADRRWLRRSLRVARNSVAALPGGRMYRLLATLGRGLKHRIGWKQIGIAASLIIIAFAITTLVRTLKGVDTGVMLVALTEIAP
jgi:hypothetical protein